MFCKQCGKEIKDGTLFCTYCGAKAAAPQRQRKAAEPVPVRRENTGIPKPLLYALVIGVLLLAAAALVYAIWSGSARKKEDEDSWRREEDIEDRDMRDDWEEDSWQPEEAKAPPEEAVSKEPAAEAPAIEEPLEQPEEPAGQYVLPDSDSRYLTMSDLKGFSEAECRLARNELYARHGRIFQDENLQAYFDACDWYQGTIEPEDFDESVLNDYEKANRDLIVQYEKDQGMR